MERLREARLARALLVLALGAGAALRLWLAFHDDGIAWPDEVYQSLEPAHRLVFGYGLVAWEFARGARNWALPGFVAFWFALCDRLGLDDPRVYIPVVRVVFCAIGVGSAAGTWLLARRSGARPLSAAAATAIVALAAPAIYFAPRAMSENAAMLPLVVGLALALPPGASRARTWAGAGLVGLAVLLRLQCGVIAAGLPVALAVRRDWRRTADALAALALGALAYGLLDRLTWAGLPDVRYGGWFHSFLAYVQFNLVEGRASDYGTAPWSYYATTLVTAAPALAVVGGGLALAGLRRAPALWIITAAFLAAHAAVPHKELRFVLPALPLVATLVAVGLDVVADRRVRLGLTLAVIVAAGWSAVTFRTLTFGDIGNPGWGASKSAYDNSGPVNRLLLAAHDVRPLCGIRLDAELMVFTGGYSYLHRRVPLFQRSELPLDSPRLSHVIMRDGPDLPGGVVARDGPLVLVQLPHPCVRRYAIDWVLR